MTTVGNTANRRILVIDDNPAIHEDFRRILQPSAGALAFLEARPALFHDVPRQAPPQDFEVACADQGQAGLAMVQHAIRHGRPYAVAFVDMRMPPGWDGVETIEQLWRVDPDLQVVICTAFADFAERPECGAARVRRLAVLRPVQADGDRALVTQLDGAITAPSANRTGAAPPTTANAVLAYFGDALDLILDAGPTAGGQPSTVVDVTADPPRVIRHGAITLAP